MFYFSFRPGFLNYVQLAERLLLDSRKLYLSWNVLLWSWTPFASCPSFVQTPPQCPASCFRSRSNEGGKTEASFHQILTRAAGRSKKLRLLGLCALEEAQAVFFSLCPICKCAGIITCKMLLRSWQGVSTVLDSELKCRGSALQALSTTEVRLWFSTPHPGSLSRCFLSPSRSSHSLLAGFSLPKLFS